ncbi:putative tryptophanyl-trna synthetase protein [Phaeoacremonium minimum UCRPA7]|uniref:Tryptophan--tRNA ligase, cytoplasmic n=1 Tax=Phaeoacremonium minimum (strain UCR-PA7) TaxID=1286976 RepID=R8BT92_PHAM7|nr:putative tryptophanyl-trna synthetase protein [Phaeoacremonium minimum UCRPA7]EOO02602.1 putative tryptophanyl-trna synthetase protein [Phaeoacremonium minimum UCRPA7]
MTVPNNAEALSESPLPASTTKQSVDPWNVQGEVNADGTVKAIDYLKLVEEFGTRAIDKELLERFEKVTGQRPHRFMRRGIVFSHRDLNLILDKYEKGEPFYLYTGRGPSSDSMHIGHTVPFEFTKWLQDVFDVPLIIMLTDDEKFLFSEKRTVEEVKGYSRNNAKDIISIGFDPKKTFIFSDYEYMGGAFYENVTRVAKFITLNQARAIFGFDDSSNVGKFFFGAVQGATSFANSFPHIFGTDSKRTQKISCLIPCAIDQDPYFRMTRDVAARLHFAKPSLIHARFLDALQGPGSKMSASIETSAIFMKDTQKQVKDKINKYAFSGGQETVELHRELGGNPDVDVAYQYLNFFMDDDEELERIRVEYKAGRMLTGEIKGICIKYLQEYVQGFQDRRSKVTDETVDHFMERRKLEYKGNPRAPIVVPVVESKPEGSEAAPEGEGKLTKNQLKKIEKQKQIEAKKAQKAKEKEEAAAAAAAKQ